MSLLTQMRTAAAGAALLLGACIGDRVDDQQPADTTTTVQQPAPVPDPAAQPAQPAPPASNMRIEVDLAARKLHVVRGGSRVASHDVAVGSSEWPTRKGEWTIGQVVFNPEFIPPDESWAEDEERKAPGASDNPLGRVQLVYDPPRSIHGTNQPGSIGKAVSHGSIRIANSVGLELASQVMEAGGVANGEAKRRQGTSNRSEKIVVDLPSPVPIRVF